MKTSLLRFFSLIALVAFAPAVLAISAPVVISHEVIKNNGLAALTIRTEPGAKVTVVGGPSDLGPSIDGEAMDDRDGVVVMPVAVVAGEKNSFSITAEIGDDISEATVYEIDLTAKKSSPAPSSVGDVTPPPAPKVDTVPATYYGKTITLTGSAESLSNIYVENSAGVRVGSTHATEAGVFRVEATLDVGKTNRLGVYAEDLAANLGSATTVVIRVPAATSSESTSDNTESKSADSVTVTVPFKDVVGHWSASYVSQLHQKGVVNGKDAETFDPNGLITRAELTKIALKAFNIPVDLSLTETSFSDVLSTDWFAPYAKVAAEKGIVQGVNGAFLPNNKITRAAALKILLLSSGSTITDDSVDFTDVPKDAWYANYVAYAKINSIVNGYADSTFRPEAPVTRGEVSKIVVKILELIK